MTSDSVRDSANEIASSEEFALVNAAKDVRLASTEYNEINIRKQYCPHRQLFHRILFHFLILFHSFETRKMKELAVGTVLIGVVAQKSPEVDQNVKFTIDPGPKIISIFKMILETVLHVSIVKIIWITISVSIQQSC